MLSGKQKCLWKCRVTPQLIQCQFLWILEEMLVENLPRVLAGTKDTQEETTLAEPLTIKWVQNGCELLQTKIHLQIPPSGLSVPIKLFWDSLISVQT